MLLNVEHISKSYGDRQLLDDVTFYLKAGDRLGVIGVNGCGKSTLLRIAAGREEPDSGSVSTDPNVRIGYLAQSPADDPEYSVLEQVYAGLDSTARALAEYEAVEILNRLGIRDPSVKIGTLSGGQRKRVALAASLVHPTDVLILDEPTNHLDAEMIAWLENYLAGYNGALLLITHDRYFLEHTTTRTAEIAFGKMYFYDGGYSSYLDGKARREEMQQASERKRQSTLRRELQWVLQGPCARGTKSRERLERYEALKAKQPPEFQEQLQEIRAVSSRLGKKTIELKNVSKSFEDRTVVRDFDFLLQRDDRVGIVGSNGSGKTTLLNLISGRLAPDSGGIDVGETVRIGYFSQHAAELDGRQTAIEYVREQGERIETRDGWLTPSKLMEKFLFPGVLQHRTIDKLSGGEKRRLFLLGILASAPNVLLLDEPTNDLDIPTLLVLEDYLETFPGAILAVSHDRYFLDRICRRVFAVEPDGSIRQIIGGYTDWQEQLEQRNAAEKAARSAAARAGKADAPSAAAAPRKASKPKFSFKEQREYETIEDDIAALEAKLHDVQAEQERFASDYVRLQELMAEQESLEQQLEEKMERWEYLSDLAERIAAWH